MSLQTGLVSVTFRQLSPTQIIELVVSAGMDSIEWGGDIHVPQGNTTQAKDVAKQTRDAGLEVACYGSYYRIGTYENPLDEFQKVLSSAQALRAPMIRVWAGQTPSAEASPKHWQKVISETHAIADLAQESNIKVAFEFHSKTLTDSEKSTCKLLENIPHKNVFSLWQPINQASQDICISSLNAVLPRLLNVHVFQWLFPGGKQDRRPLNEGQATWKPYLDILKNDKKERTFLLEFVRNDSPEQFLEDAKTLKSWLTN